MAQDDRYFPLLLLATTWASATRTPPEMVLRNLCDWIITGAIPGDALLTAAGDKVEPLDIFEARKAASAEYGSGSQVSDYRRPGLSWGTHLLQEVLVAEAGVRVFCDRTDTALPPSLGSLRSFLRVRRAKHPAPPVCPNAEEAAAKCRARLSATGRINHFREMLARLRLGGIRRSLRDRVDQVESIGIDRREWDSGRGSVQTDINRCGDVHLQHAFDALDRELAGVFGDLADRPSTEARSGDYSAPSDRAAGKVSERRLEEWYHSWIARHQAGGTIPSRDDDWDAAKAELGRGVPRDRVRLLRRRLAPVAWQDKGRRKQTERKGSS